MACGEQWTVARIGTITQVVLSKHFNPYFLSTTNLADKIVKQAIQNSFHPKRSGDIYIVFEPNIFISDFDGLDVASVHGSPWRYDSFVPVMFAGAGLSGATVDRSITPYDIAPTLSAFIGSKPPSGSIGTPLLEVLQQ